jgi:type I restriction enzyme R subunit
MLEQARRRIRGLVKLIEKSRRNVVYTDFADELGVVTETEIKGVHLGTNRERFEAKVRTYLRSHEDELAVQKLRRNRQLTTADLAWFENLFVEFGFGTREDVEEVATEHQGLGIFLRSLSGLDRTAAAAALDEFQRGRTFTASQLDFLALLTDTLARRGLVEVDDLYRHPFTRIASRGPEAATAYVATTPDAHPRAAPSADLGTGCALPRVRARGGTPVRGPT